MRLSIAKVVKCRVTISIFLRVHVGAKVGFLNCELAPIFLNR